MRALILVAGAALALSACGGAADDNSVDTLAVNNLVVDGDSNLAAEGNAVLDPTTGLPVNAGDPSAQNAVQQDLATNDADTNLANGL